MDEYDYLGYGYQLEALLQHQKKVRYPEIHKLMLMTPSDSHAKLIRAGFLRQVCYSQKHPLRLTQIPDCPGTFWCIPHAASRS